MSFKAKTGQQPLFIYSYDPPSPDNASEYDPPYPEEVMSPHNERTSFQFISTSEESQKSFEDIKDHFEGCQMSCEEMNINEEHTVEIKPDISNIDANELRVYNDVTMNMHNNRCYLKEGQCNLDEKLYHLKEEEIVNKNNLDDGKCSLNENNCYLKEEKCSLERENRPLDENNCSIKKEKQSFNEEKCLITEEESYLEVEKRSLDKNDGSLKKEKHSFNEEKCLITEEESYLEVEKRSLDKNDGSLIKEKRSPNEDKCLIKGEKTSLEGEKKSSGEEDALKTLCPNKDKYLIQGEISSLGQGKYLIKEEESTLEVEKRSLGEGNGSLYKENISDKYLIKEWKSSFEEEENGSLKIEEISLNEDEGLIKEEENSIEVEKCVQNDSNSPLISEEKKSPIISSPNREVMTAEYISCIFENELCTKSEMCETISLDKIDGSIEFNKSYYVDVNDKNEIANLVSTSRQTSESSCMDISPSSDKLAKLFSRESSSTTGKDYTSNVESVSDVARYMSPISTSQSLSSLPSDTITMNMPYDSSDNEILSFECDPETPNSAQITNNVLFLPFQQPRIASNAESVDSAIASPSLTYSPVPTDSCTITPLPYELNTPSTTNPTSTPLPSPIPSEIFIASESTPSTPSTITTSDMHYVSKRLERLTDLTNQPSADRCALTNAFIASQFDNVAVENKNSNVAQLSSMFEARCTKNNNDIDLKMKEESSSYINTHNNFNGSNIESTSNENIGDNKFSCVGNNFVNKESSPVKLENIEQDSVTNLDNDETIFGEEFSGDHNNNPRIEAPLPPPRGTSLPPPLPPPPLDDEVEFIPPIPQLPYGIDIINIDNLPPKPPLRQYLLIPLTPGYQTPILFTAPSPPPAPPRSASLSRTSSPMYSKPNTPVFDKSCPYIETFINDNGVLDSEIYNEPQNILVHCTRTENGFFRTLTPVPEEMPSCISPIRDETQDSITTILEDSRDPCCQIFDTLVEPILESSINESYNCNCNIIDMNLTNDTESSFNSRRSLLNSFTPPPLPPKPSIFKVQSTAPSLPPKKFDCHSTVLLSSPVYQCSSPSKNVNYVPSTELIMPNNTAIERNDSSPSKLDEVSSPKPIMPTPPPFPGVLNEKPAKSLMSISASGKLVIDRIDLPLPTPEEEVRKIMASATSWNWISRGSQSLAIYTQVRPTIQRGPQCGLVALSMASQVYPTTVTVDDLLNVAKERKYTNHGEMFSADNLCSLANDILDGVQAVVKTKLLSEPAEFIRHLLEGDLILLPYDSDHSHMPGNYGGRKAHWALVCGCIIQSNDLNYLPGEQSLKPDIQMDNLWHYRPKNVGIDVLNRPQSVPILSENYSVHLNHRSARSVTPNLTPTFDLFDDEWRHKISSLIVLWRQGKSRHLIASPLEELRLSNGQLFEYPDSGNYIIDSVSEGLGGKLIVLHKMKQGLSDLLGVLQGSKSVQ